MAERSSISPDDIERLLFYLGDARDFIIKYGAAQGFQSHERATSEHAMQAIDSLAEQITSNPQYFWMGNASATGDKRAFDQAMEKVTKRRRLLGVSIPVSAIKIPVLLGIAK
jgi:hypothetical protein